MRAFSATLRLPTRSGLVALLGVATGKRAGQAWESGAEAIVGIRGDEARLTGETVLLREGGRWVARVGVETLARGEYLAVVDTVEATVPHPVRLAPGAQTLTIPLPASPSAAPRLREAWLYDVRGAAVLLDTLSIP